MNESKDQSGQPRIDYDGQWKRIIQAFFKEFLAFFLPDLLPDVDLTKAPEFLEQELATIVPEQTAKGRMSVDKLLKIPMKNGDYEHVFLHVEVQSQKKANFLERTFKYFYRIFDSKGKGVTAFVIYTHDDVPTPHDRFEYKFRGTELTYKFNSYLVRDADEEELLKSDNIFALVVLTCKYLNRTKNDVELRRDFKLKLFRLAFERGYPKETLRSLMNFINILMYLPPKIDQQFWTELKRESKQSKMIVDRIMVLDKDEDVHEALKVEFTKDIKAELTEDIKAELTEDIRAEVVEEIKVEVEEQKKASVRKLILSGFHSLTDIANIMDISMEEVLGVKAEIDAQN